MEAFNLRDQRKYRAITQQMSITYFKLQDNKTDFHVGVIGSRKIPYILYFCQSTMSITCTCPDYLKREYKPLCKHMLFIISLSNQRNIFNNLMSHDELKNATKLSAIRQSIMDIIDKKKLNSELEESNTVSIERDDYCSICMCDLEEHIEKCSVCEHVMHISCINSWWNLSNSWNYIKNRCPYCKDPKGLSHLRHNDEDPWRNFDFSIDVLQPVEEADQPVQDAPLLQLQPVEEADQPVQDAPLLQLQPVEEVDQPVQDAPLLQLQPVEEVDQPVQDAPLLQLQPVEEVDQPVQDEPLLQLQPVEEVDQPVQDSPLRFQNLINVLINAASIIERVRNMNINNPRLQYLNSYLESIEQENNEIQNAFEAQED
jgi:hypothetical protein